ncbi:MAG: hypothetical protein RMJ98_21305, partial [Myxococcales bacterium]|nr:hypothetical protein [Polyangiaceae bacterium]MDW8251842.1 hypothetical protein [Myxococcales bacterium]
KPEGCESNATTFQRVDAFLACQGSVCHDSCYSAGGAGGAAGKGTGGSGGNSGCTGIFGGGCGTCLEAKCCEAVAKCMANKVCHECAVDHDPDVCHSDPAGHSLYHAMGACAQKHCKKECF